MSQASSIRFFVPQLLGNAAAVIFTVPTTPGTVLLDFCQVQFTNVDSTNRAVTVYAVPEGGAPLPENCIALGIPVPTLNQSVKLQLPMMEPGDMLYAFADVADKVSISQLSGVLSTES
jgi:hypothetical protein